MKKEDIYSLHVEKMLDKCVIYECRLEEDLREVI